MIVTSKFREVGSRIRQRFRPRALEWEHAIMTALYGAIVLANPAVFAGPSYVAFPQSPTLIGFSILMAGLLRIGALCVNGYMARPTAIVRAAAAISGIILFSLLSLGFLFSWTWPTALALYPVVGFFGLFSLYWAIFDVAIPDRHDEHS